MKDSESMVSKAELLTVLRDVMLPRVHTMVVEEIAMPLVLVMNDLATALCQSGGDPQGLAERLASTAATCREPHQAALVSAVAEHCRRLASAGPDGPPPQDPRRVALRLIRTGEAPRQTPLSPARASADAGKTGGSGESCGNVPDEPGPGIG